MTIDIIDYTSEQLAALTAGQLQQILSAQKRKNALEKAFVQKVATAKAEAIQNGILHSDAWALTKAAMLEEHEEELRLLREGLLFYLQYAVKPNETQANFCPYKLDYSLDIIERYNYVKGYYETEHPDAGLRFEAFKNDKYAKTYLGETYYSLYDVFRLQAEQ